MAKFSIHISGNRLISNSELAKALQKKSSIGEILEGKVHYSLYEALYLAEKGKAILFKGEKAVSANDLLEMAEKKDKKFFIKFRVYSELRDKGYILKTALKYGADFRAYEKGKSISEGHSKWVVFTVSESDRMSWQDFAAKNRVAHSIKKNLLIAVVDDEGDTTYYEVSWLRP